MPRGPEQRKFQLVSSLGCPATTTRRDPSPKETKMLKKNLVLGGVASLAVALAIAPAFAQSPPQYPDFSLPWEVAQTTQLNAQQASEPGIITSTASVATAGTTGVVASTDNSEDIVAYNQALANAQNDQSQF